MNNLVLLIFAILSLIEITPIQINPWKTLANAIKNFLFSDIQEQIKILEQKIEEDKIDNIRWNVLDFANSCRQGRKHTKEEWDHCINEIGWYEHNCVNHCIPNGVMEESCEYLQNCYQERLRKNDFL